MATIGNANNASFLNTSRLSYIATAPFNNNFFTYSTTTNNIGAVVGVFTAVSGATLANCPAGRVLRETGRKLIPGANPMPSGYNTYMVSVYDAQTQLTGFIDPNSQVFAIYNNDKPNFIADGVDPTAHVTDAGQSVFTLGSGTFGQFLSTGTYLTTNTYANIGTYATAGTYIAANTYLAANTTTSAGTLTYAGTGAIVSSGQVRVNRNYAYTVVGGNTYNIDCSLSQVYTINASYTNASAGGTVYIYLEATSNGTSTDLSSLTGGVYYFILNAVTGSINGNALGIIFNSQFRRNSVSNIISVPQNSNVTWTIAFACDGTNLIEIYRTQNNSG